MKKQTVLFPLIALCLMTAYKVIGDKNCEERADEIKVNITDCCDIPEFVDDKTVKETYNKVLKESKTEPGTPLFDCMIEQTLYKTLKLIDSKGNFDVLKMTALIGEKIKDAALKKMMTDSVSKCIAESQKYAEVYQKDTKVPKETCDFKFDAFKDCMDIAIFMQCPETAWIKNHPNTNASIIKECDEAKLFIKDCYMDPEAIEEFLDHHKD